MHTSPHRGRTRGTGHGFDPEARHGGGPGHEHGFGRGPGRPPFGGPFGGPFGDPFGRHGHGRRGGRRNRAGNVRTAVLVLLRERPMHGYEMIGEISERSNGLWRPSPGSLYPAIQLMQDEGLVTVERSGSKRLVSLTDTGRVEADRLAANPAPWDEVADSVDDSAIELRNAVGQVMGAAVQVGQVGTPAQRTRAVELLAEVRRRLYAVLAEDETPEPTGTDAPAETEG